jgi:LPS-assembly lipoprotein
MKDRSRFVVSPVVGLLALAAAALALQGCGFTPLYATDTAGGGPALRSVNFAGLEASETSRPFIERALGRRFGGDDDLGAAYDLFLSVREQAQPLAVQLDDSVTRYNYRLDGTYTLTDRTSGKSLTGRASSVASFNVVNSQYSTLYAEEAAREKAARVLTEEVERDILLKLAGARETEAVARRPK